jgi:DnaJ-domain-containing protein 1
MSNFLSKLWPVLLAIYIISPFDAHPLFFDDLIASVALFYMIYKNAKRKQQSEQYHSNSGSDYNSQGKTAYSSSQLTLDEAYKVLGVKNSSSLDEISKAYKEKMIMSHPDKVSHLSIELQEKAKELTLRLNDAFDLIKKSRK